MPHDLRRAGFDVVGTPFGHLPDTNTWWKHGYDGFQLSMFCDGYIIQMPLTEYEGVVAVDGYYTEGNRLAAIAQSANPATKDSATTVAQLAAGLRQDTEIQRILGLTVIDYANYGR